MISVDFVVLNSFGGQPKITESTQTAETKSYTTQRDPFDALLQLLGRHQCGQIVVVAS